jgi:hypothetical protein
VNNGLLGWEELGQRKELRGSQARCMRAVHTKYKRQRNGNVGEATVNGSIAMVTVSQ